MTDDFPTLQFISYVGWRDVYLPLRYDYTLLSRVFKSLHEPQEFRLPAEWTVFGLRDEHPHIAASRRTWKPVMTV